jgi:hypothetical protein
MNFAKRSPNPPPHRVEVADGLTRRRNYRRRAVGLFLEIIGNGGHAGGEEQLPHVHCGTSKPNAFRKRVWVHSGAGTPKACRTRRPGAVNIRKAAAAMISAMTAKTLRIQS